MPNYPQSLDDDVSLFLAVNNARTRLTSSITVSDLTIPVVTTSGFPNQGFVTILTNPDDITEAEAIRYVGLSPTTFSGVERGAGGTPTFGHAVGNFVDLTVMAEHHNELKDAVIALEQTVGISGSHNFVPKDAQGNVIISGTLDVSGVTTLGSDLSIAGELDASGVTTLGSDLSVGGALTASGVTTLGSNVSASGSLVVGGDLTISGTSSLADDVDMKETLTVSGSALFGKLPVDPTADVIGQFNDTPASTTSQTFTTVMAAPALGSGEHLVLYRGNTGLDSVSSNTIGLMEIKARVTSTEIGFGAALAGDDGAGRKDGHGDASEIAGFKMVDSPGSVVDIQVRGDVASAKTVEYGALGIVAVPFGQMGLVNGTHYWTYDSGDAERTSTFPADSWVTKDTFAFTAPDPGDYLFLASCEGRSTHEIAIRYRLNAVVLAVPSSVGQNTYTPFPSALILSLTAGLNTITMQQLAGFVGGATAKSRRCRFVIVKASSFSQIQSVQDVVTQDTTSATFSELTDFSQTFVSAVQQQVLVIGTVGFETALSSETTVAAYKLRNTTDAKDYAVDSGMPLFNTGSGSDNKMTMLFTLLDDVVSSKNFAIYFRNLTDNGLTLTNTSGALVMWGLGAPIITAPDIPITTVDGNIITTHSINSDSGTIGTLAVTGATTLSGVTTAGFITAASGIFDEVLMISGVPVATGTGGGAGNITDINEQSGPSVTITGVGTVNTLTAGNAITVSGSLRVRETDSDPLVDQVTEIVVTTGTLTDLGSGVVQIDTSGFGGSGGGSGTITDINTVATGPSVTITGVGSIDTITEGNVITVSGAAFNAGTLVGFRGAKVVSSSGIDVANGVTVFNGNGGLPFDTVVFDTDGFFDTVNEGRFIIPAGIKKVRATYSTNFPADLDGDRIVFISFNGATAGSMRVAPALDGSDTRLQAWTGIIDVAEGDIFTPGVRHTAGTTLTLPASSNDNLHFSIEVMDPTAAVPNDLSTISGSFTQSLTISGAPVSTGTGGGGSANNLQDAYDNDDGTIATTGGKPFALTNTGELVAVTGTFTGGLTVGSSSSVINNTSITTGSGIFTNSLTISGVPVSTGTGGGGVSDHSLLSNLDFASAGHIGFASSTELSNASGTLSSEIDSDISTHAAVSDAHHVRYVDSEAVAALESTTSALAASGVATDVNVAFNTTLIITTSGHLQTQIDTVEGSDVDAITVSGGSDITGNIDFVGSNGVNVSAAGNIITFDGGGVSGGGGGGGGSSTLQEAYDIGDGIIIADVAKPFQVTGSGIVTGSLVVGTTTPLAQLHVEGSSFLLQNTADAATDLIIDSGDSAANQGNVIFKDRGSFKWVFGKTAANNFTIFDSAGGVNAVVLNSSASNSNALVVDSGKVGIGTGSPSEKLHVAGSGIIDGDLTLQTTATADVSLDIVLDGGVSDSDWTAIRINANANIGNQNLISWLHDGIPTDQGAAIGVTRPLSERTDMRFFTTQKDIRTETMFLGGNDQFVGINTSSPTERLHVVGSGIITGNLDVSEDLTADTGAFTTGLTVSGVPVDIRQGEFLIHHEFPDATSNSITFDIPQTANVLSIDHSVRIDLSADTHLGMLLQFNSDTGSNYARSHTFHNEDGTETTQYLDATTVIIIGQVPGNSAVAGSYGAGHYTIPNYRNTTTWKSITGTAFSFSDDAATAGQKARTTAGGGTWKDTSAITSITIFHSAGRNFDTGSSITIRGY